MPWSAPAEGEEFDRAAAWFASRVPVSDADRASIPVDARSRAFWIAGVAQLDVVQHVHDEIVKALRAGTSLEDFKKQVRDALTAAWGKDDPARIGLIFRNASQNAYNAARWEQMREPTVMRVRPYWLYDAVMDHRVTKVCAACNGTLLPLEDGFWDTHTPPLHHHCFPAGTPIQTARGTVPIEQVRVGDLALTHLARFRRVTALMRSPSPERLSQITFKSGRRLTATPGHPALTERGWVELAMLREGDRVLHVPEVPVQHGVVGDAHRDHAAANNRARSAEREAVGVLRDLHGQVAVGQEEVEEQHLRALDYERVLEDVLDPHLLQERHERALRARGRHRGLGMARRVRDQLLPPGLDSLLMGLGCRAATALHEALADAGEACMVMLGTALSPMGYPGGFAFGHHPAHHGAGELAPAVVSHPLVGHRCAGVADGHAVLLQKVGRCLQSIDLQFSHQLFERQTANLVEVSEDFAESVAVLLNQPVFNGSFEVVARHDLLPSTSADVYNFSVEDDESYIASGIVVHNCRSSIRNLRRSEAEKRGISTLAPFDQPDTGFGLSPRRAREWKPEPNSRNASLLAELDRKKRDLDRRPAPPALPKTFDHSAEPVRKKQTPKETLPAGGKPVKLTPEQQKAEQTAATMRGDFRARQNASLADRRTWMLWERVRGNNRRTSVLVEQAAIRQFGLTGVPWAKGAEYTFQEADVVRAERDLRAIYDQTQAWFKRRSVRAITLYRGVHGAGDDIRRSVESWTSDKATAERFAARGTDGYVLRVTVPVTQVLVHHQVSEWVDGPLGGASEFLVMW